MHLQCPHCHDPIHVADERSDEVLCPGCGSSFRLHGTPAETTTVAEIRTIGKFQLLDRVGVGGFGSVYWARDTELDRIVAVKIPHPSLLASNSDRERFLREARAAAQLRHPGIVPVHDVTELDGMPTIISDFIEGVTLRELVSVRPLAFRESAELVAQVAEALDCAHSMRLVHREFKPANIMVEFAKGDGLGSSLTVTNSSAGDSSASSSGSRESSRSPRPRVLDFGLALRDEAEITLTVDGQIIGTPAYMRPEQAAVGWLWQSLRCHGRGFAHCERALAIQERSLGLEHPDLTASLGGLAILYSDPNKYAESESLYMQSLRILEKAVGADHPDVALVLNNLAAFYAKQGKNIAAEPIYMRALSIFEKAFGPEHPYVAHCLDNLAVVFKAQQRGDDATTCAMRSAEIRSKQPL